MSEAIVASERRRSVEGRITDEAVSLLRERIGISVRIAQPGFHLASRDLLVNYMRSIGDPNPLYRSASYAESSRWGGLTAQPTLMRAMGSADESDRPASEVQQGGRGDPIAGVHGFMSGVEMHWFRPIREGDTIVARGGLGDLTVKKSKFAEQAVHELHDKVYRNQDGQIVGVTRDLVIRVEREKSRSAGQYRDLDVPHHYSESEIAELDREYEQEYTRGGTPRYFEDVVIGEESVPLLKGPYTVSTFICFQMGQGLLRTPFISVHSEQFAHRKRHPRTFPVNEFGVPDSIARVHWDHAMALESGLPDTYDAGAERMAAVSHAFTNWMGDDGFLRRLNIQVRGFVFVGDVYRINLRVVGKNAAPSGGLVRLEFEGRNQRGDVVLRGDGDVLLPVRSIGPVMVPIEQHEPVSPFESMH